MGDKLDKALNEGLEKTLSGVRSYTVDGETITLLSPSDLLAAERLLKSRKRQRAALALQKAKFRTRNDW